jgi:hypothetical protein
MNREWEFSGYFVCPLRLPHRTGAGFQARGREEYSIKALKGHGSNVVEGRGCSIISRTGISRPIGLIPLLILIFRHGNIMPFAPCDCVGIDMPCIWHRQTMGFLIFGRWSLPGPLIFSHPFSLLRSPSSVRPYSLPSSPSQLPSLRIKLMFFSSLLR